MPKRKTKPRLPISFMVDPELLKRIDDAAHALGLSRASFLRMAAIKQLPMQNEVDRESDLFIPFSMIWNTPEAQWKS